MSWSPCLHLPSAVTVCGIMYAPTYGLWPAGNGFQDLCHLDRHSPCRATLPALIVLFLLFCKMENFQNEKWWRFLLHYQSPRRPGASRIWKVPVSHQLQANRMALVHTFMWKDHQAECGGADSRPCTQKHRRDATILGYTVRPCIQKRRAEGERGGGQGRREEEEEAEDGSDLDSVINVGHPEQM